MDFFSPTFNQRKPGDKFLKRLIANTKLLGGSVAGKDVVDLVAVGSIGKDGEMVDCKLQMMVGMLNIRSLVVGAMANAISNCLAVGMTGDSRK